METKRNLTDGFHRLSRKERLRRLQELCALSDEDIDVLSGNQPLSLDIAEHLIENVIGYFPIPMGVATNFTIDGRE
ncbi:MAG: 3-hydroxy-3-methylglutaryl-CoA reductase, partial [Bdellovibrionota bacterium]